MLYLFGGIAILVGVLLLGYLFINANPARLDIDWRWGPELRSQGTLVSVNPDAHETAGLDDVKFGVAMARKALLPKELVVNSRTAQEVERWLKRA